MQIAFYALLALLLTTSACAPFMAERSLKEATKELSDAKTAGALQAAPYETQAAETYLDKSHEEYGYSDYSASLRYIQKSRDFTKKAMALILEKSPPPSAPPISEQKVPEKIIPTSTNGSKP